LRNLSKFIQLRSISKSWFSGLTLTQISDLPTT
jgi:hypothetical protein